MKTFSSLTFTSAMHDRIKRHLFPGDGLEAAAIILCSKAPGNRPRLLAKHCIMVPYDQCGTRTADSLSWAGIFLEEAIDYGEKEKLSIVLIHSHPGGYLDFSEVDNESDLASISCLFHAYGSEHGSAIMVPSGRILARCYDSEMRSTAIDLVMVAGDEIELWWNDQRQDPPIHPMAFSSGMANNNNKLHAAVIGVSGTGSIVAEQLGRLGLGKITLVDFDHIEHKNLNRILYSSLSHADDQVKKVAVLADAINSYRSEQTAFPIADSILARDSILALANCDVIFSCVDSQTGRYVADLISSAFLIPLFDVGVVIPTIINPSGNPLITDVVGRIDYIQPGGSTLGDRGIYTPETLRAEYLREVAPEIYKQELQDGYIKGVVEEAPSVVTLNMRAASAVVNEFIARTYPYRQYKNRNYARTVFSLAENEEEYFSEDHFKSGRNNSLIARGDKEPLLGLQAMKKSGLVL